MPSRRTELLIPEDGGLAGGEGVGVGILLGAGGDAGEAGEVTAAIQRLREAGHVYEDEGATWFRSTTFGDDKDRVLVRSSGEPTYFAADVAYLLDKFDRGFTHLVYILGPDHHGTIKRWKGAAAGLGHDPDAVEIIIYQHVSLAGGAAMSKREGSFVTLDELVDEVGADATRFLFTLRSANQHLEFDLDLARQQTNENPVYYVQYAHARCSSILRQPEAEALPTEPGDTASLLVHPAEQALIGQLLRLPRRERAGAPHHDQLAVAQQPGDELARALDRPDHAGVRDARPAVGTTTRPRPSTSWTEAMRVCRPPRAARNATLARGTGA